MWTQEVSSALPVNFSCGNVANLQKSWKDCAESAHVRPSPWFPFFPRQVHVCLRATHTTHTCPRVCPHSHPCAGAHGPLIAVSAMSQPVAWPS